MSNIKRYLEDLNDYKRDIKIVGDSITFTNRGIGFFQAGVAHEILALISDLKDENEKLRKLLGDKEDTEDEDDKPVLMTREELFKAYYK